MRDISSRFRRANVVKYKYAHWLAYAIFSVYIPLAKNNMRVVIATNNRLLAIYGGNTISVSGM